MTAQRIDRQPRHDAILALHAHRGAAAGRPFRRLPGPFAAIVIDLGGTGTWREAGERTWRPYPRIALHGLMRGWTEAGARPPTTDCLMALLEPWAAGPFLGLPAAATVDRVTDLEAALPGWGRSLVAELGRLDNPCDRIAQLEDMIAGRLDRTAPPAGLSHFLAASRASGGALRLRAYARAVGHSDRSLRHRVNAGLGIGPKRWCRLERFSANLIRLHPDPWRRAAAPDYFDQAHEIHEFRHLAGITPGAYRREKEAGDRRVYATG